MYQLYSKFDRASLTPSIPYPHSLVPWGSDQDFRLGRVPTELVYTAWMYLVVSFFALRTHFKSIEYGWYKVCTDKINSELMWHRSGLTSLSDSSAHMVTDLSNDPLAKREPSALHDTEWTCNNSQSIKFRQNDNCNESKHSQGSQGSNFKLSSLWRNEKHILCFFYCPQSEFWARCTLHCPCFSASYHVC